VELERLVQLLQGLNAVLLSMRPLDDADETTGCTSREHVRVRTNRAGSAGIRSGAGASADSGAATTSRLTSVWIATVGALDAFVRGSERRIDLAGVEGRVFINNASLGVYAKIVQSAGYRDATAETVARVVPDLFPISGEPFDLRFPPPGGTCGDGAGLLQVSKNPYRPPHPGTNGTRDALDTHVLSIIAVRAVKPRELITLLPPEPPARALGTGVARVLGAGVHSRRRRARRGCPRWRARRARPATRVHVASSGVAAAVPAHRRASHLRRPQSQRDRPRTLSLSCCGARVVAHGSCAGATRSAALLIVAETSRAVADDDLFPRPFAWTDGNDTPWFGILVGAALPSLLMLWRYSNDTGLTVFTYLVNLTVVTVAIPYFMSAIAQLTYLVSRRRRVQGRLLARDLSVAGASVLFSMWVTFASGYQAVYQGLVAILAGLVLYVFVKARRERLGEVTEPVDVEPDRAAATQPVRAAL
jgi:Amino acid permease